MSESPFIIISQRVYEDSELKESEQMFFGRINSLSNKYGFCYMSNENLSKFCNKSVKSVQRYIQHLKKRKHIFVIPHSKDTTIVSNRLLFTHHHYPEFARVRAYMDKYNLKGITIEQASELSFATRTQASELSFEQTSELSPHIDKSISTITSVISTNVSNISRVNAPDTQELELENQIDYVLQFFNDHCRRQFALDTSSSRTLIKAVLEKYIVEDIELVIKFKYLQSVTYGKKKQLLFDPQYLRPKTIFNFSNFESYYNAAIISLKNGELSGENKTNAAIRRSQALKKQYGDL